MPPLLLDPECDSSDHSSRTATISTENIRKRRSVSFFPQAIVYDHIHLKNLSHEEKRRTWYCKRELHFIQRDCAETVRWMVEGIKSVSSDIDIEYCSRGLEYRTTLGSKLRRKQRLDALGKVLEYQYYAWESGIDVRPESLARVYSSYSDHSSRVARLMACIDEQSLDELKDDPSEEPVTSSDGYSAVTSPKAGGLAIAA
jgi:hypothetical protein